MISVKLRIFSCIKKILVYCKGPPYLKKKKKNPPSIIVLLILFLQTLSCAFSMRRMDSIMEVSSPSCLLHTRPSPFWGRTNCIFEIPSRKVQSLVIKRVKKTNRYMTMRSGAKNGIFLGEKNSFVLIIFFQNARTRRWRDKRKSFQKKNYITVGKIWSQFFLIYKNNKKTL